MLQLEAVSSNAIVQISIVVGSLFCCFVLIIAVYLSVYYCTRNKKASTIGDLAQIKEDHEKIKEQNEDIDRAMSVIEVNIRKGTVHAATIKREVDRKEKQRKATVMAKEKNQKAANPTKNEKKSK